METSKNVTCNNCGWVSFEVSREFAISEVEQFNKYFLTLSKEEQELYYGGECSTIKFYEGCFFCGGSYKNFRPSVSGDCPNGSTLNPIIKKED